MSAKSTGSSHKPRDSKTEARDAPPIQNVDSVPEIKHGNAMPVQPSEQQIPSDSDIPTQTSSSMAMLTIPGQASNRSIIDSKADGQDGSALSRKRSSRFSVASRKVGKIVSATRMIADDDEDALLEIPHDFKVMPVYKQILEGDLPAMDVFPLLCPKDGKFDEVVTEMDRRIKESPNIKTFIQETRKVFTYALQEIQLRKEMQDQLRRREEQLSAALDRHKHDPRLSKILTLADHWRREKEDGDEKIQSLQGEINTVMMDMKTMETRMISLNKKHDRMEQQIQKAKNCETEKERLEEHCMQKEQQLSDLSANFDALKAAVEQLESEAVTKENDFRIKLEAAPDRHAHLVAALARELEMMSIEKENKVQEARDLHGQVKCLVMQTGRNSDKLTMLMKTVKYLKVQSKNLERQYQSLVSRNKGLERHLETSRFNAKLSVKDAEKMCKENQELKTVIQVLKLKVKREEEKHIRCHRRVTNLEDRIEALSSQLTEKNVTISGLKKDVVDVRKEVDSGERQKMDALQVQQLESKKVALLQQKLKASTNHLKFASINMKKMNAYIDKTVEMFGIISSEAHQCEQENDKNQVTITHLRKLLDSSEEIARLRTHENEALLISKDKLVAALRDCSMSHKRLQNNMIQVQAAKINLEDTNFAHRFMMEFVETERDGARRLAKLRDETFVIMKRYQLRDLSRIAQCNLESSRLKIKIQELNSQLISQKKEILSLSQVLREAEQTSRQAHNWCKTLIHQRDMFGTRLLQQKTEAQLSAMKMGTLTNLLDAASTGYRDRCSDIAVLRKEVTNLRRKVNRLKRVDETSCELRSELASTAKALSLEMSKRAALEHMRIQNIHYHRKIMSSDCSTYELILKIQRLQKFLIRKSQDCIAKEKEISIRNDSIKTLQIQVQRREANIPETSLRMDLQLKDKKIKALTAEVRMLKYYDEVNTKLAEEKNQELGEAKVKLVHLRRAKSASVGSATKTSTQKKHPDATDLNRNQSNKAQAPRTSKRQCARSDHFY